MTKTKSEQDPEIVSVSEEEVDPSGIEGFDMGCDAASFGDDFDPLQAIGQLLVTQEGETIPDVLVGIRRSLDTLTKVLHRISKQYEQKK